MKNINLRKIIFVLLFGSLAVLLTGCASIVNGTNQPISVETTPTPGAKCSLENNKGKWFVNTPGSVVVHRSYSELDIACQKKGYKPTHKKIASNTKPMAFGNILFGGLIGAGVDVANGSAYDYPQNIQVAMEKR